MFLANQNFPSQSIFILRKKGYRVLSIQESYPGISDEEVMKIAKKFRLTILTFDKDYGELIFKYSPVNPSSVIFFRFKGNSPLFAGKLLCKLLASEKIKFKNYFTVIETHNMCQRELFHSSKYENLSK